MAKRVEKYPEIVYRKHPNPLSPHPSPWVRQPGRHLPLFLLLVCLSCGIIAVDVRFGFSWVSQLSEVAASPVIFALDLIFKPVSNSASFFRETLSARTENEALKTQVEKLEYEVGQYQSAYHENIRLRNLLDLKAQVAPQAMAAEVLRYEDSAASRVMLLKGGVEDGFRKGQPVLGESGQLLGRIAQIHRNTSVVRLITDPSCRIGVTVERTRAQGILHSRDGRLYIRLDRTELVATGDRVLTSHLSNLYPKDLAIGAIGERAGPTASDPMVAVELGLMTGYRVEPVVPTERWKEYQEVLCLPNFTPPTGESDAAEP